MKETVELGCTPTNGANLLNNRLFSQRFKQVHFNLKFKSVILYEYILNKEFSKASQLTAIITMNLKLKYKNKL